MNRYLRRIAARRRCNQAVQACRRRRPDVTPLGFYTALVGALAYDIDDDTWADAVAAALALDHEVVEIAAPLNPPTPASTSPAPADQPGAGSKVATAVESAACAGDGARRRLTLVEPLPPAVQVEREVCGVPSPLLPADFVCVNRRCDGVHHRFGLLEGAH